VFLVPFEQIVVNEEKNNLRADYGNIEELATSIAESGLKNPILLKKLEGKNALNSCMVTADSEQSNPLLIK